MRIRFAMRFGDDSLIELLSAAVVFWRFRFQMDEARAARIAGGLLLVLAGLVVLTSGLNFIGYREAERSLIGITILLAAAVAMPLRQNSSYIASGTLLVTAQEYVMR